MKQKFKVPKMGQLVLWNKKENDQNDHVLHKTVNIKW